MLDCKELTGKESAEKYELNCKRKSKKKRAWERMLCAKKAWVNTSHAWDASHAVKRSQL